MSRDLSLSSLENCHAKFDTHFNTCSSLILRQIVWHALRSIIYLNSYNI